MSQQNLVQNTLNIIVKDNRCTCSYYKVLKLLDLNLNTKAVLHARNCPLRHELNKEV